MGSPMVDRTWEEKNMAPVAEGAELQSRAAIAAQGCKALACPEAGWLWEVRRWASWQSREASGSSGALRSKWSCIKQAAARNPRPSRLPNPLHSHLAPGRRGATMTWASRPRRMMTGRRRKEEFDCPCGRPLLDLCLSRGLSPDSKPGRGGEGCLLSPPPRPNVLYSVDRAGGEGGRCPKPEDQKEGRVPGSSSPHPGT